MDIGVLNEKALHAALKDWYALPGDQLEVKVDGYFIDIVRDDLLIEIQTRNFSAIKRKLFDLIGRHPLRLVYPIPREKWIVRQPKESGGSQTRRKSPKRGRVTDLFSELVSFPELLSSPRFSLELLLIQEEEVRCYDGRKGWRRRGWVTEERHLLRVLESHLFQDAADLWGLIPEGLPDEFTTVDLTRVLAVPKRIAQQAAYCLRKADQIDQVGKRGRSHLYVRK